MGSIRNFTSLMVAACLVVSCGTASKTGAPEAVGLADSGQAPWLSDETPEAMWQRIANDEHRDWSTGFVHSYRVEQIRQEARARKKSYQVQQVGTEVGSNPRFIGFFTEPSTCEDLHDNGNGNGVGNSQAKVGHGYGLCKNEPQRPAGFQVLQAANIGLTAPLTGPPTTDGAGHEWWLTEDGKVFRYNTGSGTAPFLDFQIKDTAGNVVSDSFQKSNLTLYATGAGGPQVAFVCSATGNFYAIDMTVGSANYGKTGTLVSMGPVDPLVGYVPPVFFDNAAGTSGPIQAYALSNSGTTGTNRVRLHRFVVNRTTATATLASSMSTLLAPALAAPFTEFARTAPIVFNRQLSFGTWRRHNTSSPGADRGGVYHYNLSAWLTSSGATPPTLVRSGALNRPVTTPPSIDIDGAGNTKYVFQPSGNYLNFLNLVTNTLNVGFNAMVLNPGDPDSGDMNALNFGFNNEQPPRVELAGGIQGQSNILYKIGASSAYTVAVLNGNSLWKVSLPAPTDGVFNPDYSVAASAARDTAFQTNDNWTFTKTESGRTWGTVDGAGKYVTNPCFPTAFYMFNGTPRVMMALLDNWGGPSTSTHTVGQMFNMKMDTPAAPPALSAGGLGPASTGDLHLAAPPAGIDAATELAGEFMTYDFRTVNNTTNTVELLFNTRSNTSNATQSAALWQWIAPLNP